MRNLKLFLMTAKGAQVLKSIVDFDAAHLIKYVVVGIDKNQIDDYSEKIVQYCKSFNIEYYTRGKDPGLETDYSIAVSWRWMLPVTPGSIVFHDSPLPRYRGFAPLVNQLIQGDSQIGVTAFFSTDEYDQGNIIGKETCDISYPIKINDAIDLTLPLYHRLTLRIIEKIKANREIEAYKQNEEDATYSLWRDETDYFIDWSKDSSYIKRFVDATGFPYEGSRTRFNDNVVIINDVSIVTDVFIHNRDVGKILRMNDGHPIVVCGNGLIQIDDAIEKNSGKSILGMIPFRSRFI